MSILSLSLTVFVLSKFNSKQSCYVQIKNEKSLKKNYPWLDLNYNGFLECHVSV